MKKCLVMFLSVIIAGSFSGVVLAADIDTPSAAKITKQIILAEDYPAPAPAPVPAPAPEPVPVPAPAPEPGPK